MLGAFLVIKDGHSGSITPLLGNFAGFILKDSREFPLNGLLYHPSNASQFHLSFTVHSPFSHPWSSHPILPSPPETSILYPIPRDIHVSPLEPFFLLYGSEDCSLCAGVWEVNTGMRPAQAEDLSSHLQDLNIDHLTGGSQVYTIN